MPVEPSGRSDGVVIVGPGIMVMDNPAAPVPPTLSVTLKITVTGPIAPVGVPVIAPFVGFNDRLAGRVPD